MRVSRQQAAEDLVCSSFLPNGPKEIKPPFPRMKEPLLIMLILFLEIFISRGSKLQASASHLRGVFSGQLLLPDTQLVLLCFLLAMNILFSVAEVTLSIALFPSLG